MYSSLFLCALAQACLLQNWLAGPVYLVVFGIMFAFRVGPEEAMMRAEFGAAYAAYCRRTKRIIPGVY
jgi:protein-S-isoprenylcysteine O-methyltransferase Ste14